MAGDHTHVPADQGYRQPEDSFRVGDHPTRTLRFPNAGAVSGNCDLSHPQRIRASPSGRSIGEFRRARTSRFILPEIIQVALGAGCTNAVPTEEPQIPGAISPTSPGETRSRKIPRGLETEGAILSGC